MMNKKNNVIVTGGAGFIGSHIVDLLVNEKKYNVYSLDNYATFHGNTPKDRMNASARYLRCDIRNLDVLSEIFKKVRPLYVFHTAALARIQPSIKDPATSFSNNVFKKFVVISNRGPSIVQELIFLYFN